MKQFSNLRILNCAGNPISKDQNYKHFTLSRLKYLKYMDYSLIEPEAVPYSNLSSYKVLQAREIYQDALIAIEEEDKILYAETVHLAKTAQQETIYQAAHIPHIDEFLPTLFTLDPEFQKLLPIIMEVFADFKQENIIKLTQKVGQLKSFALEKASDKVLEIGAFRECIRECQEQHDSICHAQINQFSHEKKSV